MIDLAVEVSQQAYVPYSHFPIRLYCYWRMEKSKYRCQYRKCQSWFDQLWRTDSHFKLFLKTREFQARIWSKQKSPSHVVLVARSCEFFEPDLPVTLLSKDHRRNSWWRSEFTSILLYRPDLMGLWGGLLTLSILHNIYNNLGGVRNEQKQWLGLGLVTVILSDLQHVGNRASKKISKLRIKNLKSYRYRYWWCGWQIIQAQSA